MAPKQQSSIKTRLTRQTKSSSSSGGKVVEVKSPLVFDKKKKIDKKKQYSTIDTDKKDTSNLLKELVAPRVIQVHQENLSDTDKKLRGFDLDYNYGPCVGLTRLERWERASSLGLDPPKEIKAILLKEAKSQECLFHGNVI